MQNLDYTIYAAANFERYEESTYGRNSLNVYHLMMSGTLNYDEILWYQAFEGFSFLCRTPHKNKMLATELRRYIFICHLGGKELYDAANKRAVFKTCDGEVYTDLTAPALLTKMADTVRQCYVEAHICRDEQTEHIPVNRQHVIEILRNGRLKRRSLLRMCFALGMDIADTQRMLSQGAFLRKLNIAIPYELILFYCMSNGIRDWNVVLELQQVSREYLDTGKEEEMPQTPVSTVTEEEAWASRLVGMERKIFQEHILWECCAASRLKTDQENFKSDKQYSVTARSTLHELSILADVEKNMSNCTVYEGYHTCYLTDTVLRYGEVFPLSNYLPQIPAGRVMSKDLYCRFLNYRTMLPNPPGGHNTQFYSMEQGMLPEEILNNVLSYSEIITLAQKAHRIDRYDILIALFYRFLMEEWKDPAHSFLAAEQKEADAQWRKFFNLANSTLNRLGYAGLSYKNPLDALLRISFHALSPLECYTRIYELNVLSGMAKGKMSKGRYPPEERVKDVAGSLLATYKKLADLSDGMKPRFSEAEAFCHELLVANNS